MSTVSILIADTHDLIRRGLRSLIQETAGFDVLHEADDAEDLRHIVTETRPGMVIMDHRDSAFGLRSVRLIKELAPETPIIIISSEDNKAAISEVLELGVQSFLTKSCGEEEIADALRATARGEKFFCTRVIDFLLEKSFANGEEPDCSPTPLTARELDIVRLTARGLVAKEIASRLNLSTHTVYTHRKNIMKKLQLNSSSELVLYAVNHGILDA